MKKVLIIGSGINAVVSDCEDGDSVDSHIADTLKGDIITIRPLRKFPVIHDLIVDRSSIHENLKRTNVFIGEYQPQNKVFYNSALLHASISRSKLHAAFAGLVDGRTVALIFV